MRSWAHKIVSAAAPGKRATDDGDRPLAGRHVLLADYLRQTGASVEVLGAPAVRARLAQGQVPDLVALSPGPGKPFRFRRHVGATHYTHARQAFDHRRAAA